MTLKVNGELIPDQAIEYEFQRLVKFYSDHLTSDQLRQQLDALRRKAKEQAVGVKLLIDEANRLDLPVGDDDVEQRFQKMVQGAGSPQKFAELLKRQRLTEPLVRENIRIGRRVDKLVEKIVEGIPDPTEEEMKAHFAGHSAEYVVPEQAQVQHILIKPDSGGEEARQAAKSRLLEIKERIAAGADFADQAAAHSHCPSGRKTGGSLGWLGRGSMVPTIDAAVFSMGVGELSEIVETKLGFHLIKKVDGAESRRANFDEVSDKIREFLRHVRRGEAITAYVEDLKQKARIEEDEAQLPNDG